MKSLFASKTFWVNLLGGIASTAGTVSGVIPPKYGAGIMAAGSIANIVLRTITKEPVTITGDPTSPVDTKRFTAGVVLLLACLSASACTKPDLPTLLTWAQYGIDADCQFGAGALAADVCTFGKDAIDAAQAAVKKDPVTGVAAAKKILVDAEARQPKIAPYLTWLSDKL